MNTVETQHSPNNKYPIIRFGPDDDSADKVDNVKILYKNGEVWDMKQGITDATYDRVTIIKTCDSMHMLFYIHDNKLKDELFVRSDEIRSIWVNHIVKKGEVIIKDRVTEDIVME